MSDIAPEQDLAPELNIEVSANALQTSLDQMTQLYGAATKDLVVHRAVIAELHQRCNNLEQQLAALKEAATPGTVVQLDLG